MNDNFTKVYLSIITEGLFSSKEEKQQQWINKVKKLFMDSCDHKDREQKWQKAISKKVFPLYSAQTDYVDDNWCTFKEFFEDPDKWFQEMKDYQPKKNTPEYLVLTHMKQQVPKRKEWKKYQMADMGEQTAVTFKDGWKLIYKNEPSDGKWSFDKDFYKNKTGSKQSKEDTKNVIRIYETHFKDLAQLSPDMLQVAKKSYNATKAQYEELRNTVYEQLGFKEIKKEGKITFYKNTKKHDFEYIKKNIIQIFKQNISIWESTAAIPCFKIAQSEQQKKYFDIHFEYATTDLNQMTRKGFQPVVGFKGLKESIKERDQKLKSIKQYFIQCGKENNFDAQKEWKSHIEEHFKIPYYSKKQKKIKQLRLTQKVLNNAQKYLNKIKES